jgi:GNAT superfamily N-acetyltransferase
MPHAPFDIRPLTPAARVDFLDFFEQRAFTDNPEWASCYCHFPHADHRTVVWSERTAAQNRAATCARIDDGRMSGWLAYEDGAVIGWCNAGPRRAVEALFDEPEPLADRIGAIACFVIAPERRRRGLATALLDAACTGLRERGFAWAEAYPRRDPHGGPGSPAGNHFGPLAMYRRAGFEACGSDGPTGLKVRKALAAGRAPQRPGPAAA